MPLSNIQKGYTSRLRVWRHKKDNLIVLLNQINNDSNLLNYNVIESMYIWIINGRGKATNDTVWLE